LPNVHLFSVYSPFQLILGGSYADLYNSQFTGETSRSTTVALVGAKAEASPPGSSNQANSYIR
jgi:hypothetical protein